MLFELSNATICYRNQEQENYKGYGFLSFARKYKKQFLNTGLDYLKTASKKVVHKIGGILGNKIAGAVTKSNNNKIVKEEPV